MRRYSFLAVLAFLLVMTSAAAVTAQESNIRVVVNGTNIGFDDQPPALIDGRTLVPARAVFAALGYEVYWDGGAQMVTLVGSYTVRMWINSHNLEVVGRGMITLDVPPQIVNGRTMIPARAVADAIGADVGWLPATRTVTIDLAQARNYRTITFNNLLRYGYSFEQAQNIFEQEIFALFNEWREHPDQGRLAPFAPDPQFAGTSRNWARETAGIWVDFDAGRITQPQLNDRLFGHTDTISAADWGRIYPLRSSINDSFFGNMTPVAAANRWLT
ncbi:MAG: copper amine oxidase N-terminal domain-containing protein [Defluviitaleaceae bacterium]|nr:copper amine oxidase N-terminal domain-containing protein [Defluviitaleaceae bacterium]